MQTLYNELAEYFDPIAVAGSVDTQKEVKFLSSVFETHAVKSVLDIACGTGRHSVALAEAGYEVTGVDCAQKLLAIARRKSNLPNIEFRQQDVSQMKFDKKFDAAICMWSTFGELPYEQMLEQLKMALKSRGVFVIDTTYFATVPTGTAHKTYHNSADGNVIQTEIDEIYKGIRRIREITNIVNGKVFKDHSEIDVLTEGDLVGLLAGYGFGCTKIYYDYASVKPPKPRRIQLVFELQ